MPILTLDGVYSALNNLNRLVAPQIHELDGLFLWDESPCGSFKDRGAYNAVRGLSPLGQKQGVVASSSGNFATALAFVCRELGIAADIVVPHGTPKVKIDKISSLGAQVHFSEPSESGRTALVKMLHEELGRVVLHSSHQVPVIEGQATLGIEILERLKDVGTIVLPTSGGGLLAGVAFAAKQLNPRVKIVGVEPETSPDTLLSLSHDRITPVSPNQSIAEGLLTTVGEPNFELTREFVDDFVTVSEQEIAWCTLRLKRLGLTVETSGAVALAACMFSKFTPQGKVVAVLTGGNIDPNKYEELRAMTEGYFPDKL